MMNVSKPLSRASNDAVIRRLADAQAYPRGLDYFSHGHVESLVEVYDGVRAVVRGKQDYTVTLAADDGILDYSCGCPLGSDGAFCKHCVAAALAWLNREAGPVKSPRRGKLKEITLADAGKILQAEDKESLVAMMLDWAKDDDRLHERLISSMLPAVQGPTRAPPPFDGPLRRPSVCAIACITARQRTGRVESTTPSIPSNIY